MAGPVRDDRPGDVSSRVPAAGCTGNRIDYALVLGDEARFPVVDSGLLFAEPVVLADGSRMYLSDHVALTVRLGLECVPTERGR